jgi:hypothetical protein
MTNANLLTKHTDADEPILPGRKTLECRLDRAREHLVQTDEHGCMEALFCLDMFRADCYSLTLLSSPLPCRRAIMGTDA